MGGVTKISAFAFWVDQLKADEPWVMSPRWVGARVLKRLSRSLDLVVPGRYVMHGFCGWPMCYESVE